jgi:hypothetical protein
MEINSKLKGRKILHNKEVDIKLYGKGNGNKENILIDYNPKSLIKLKD